MIKTGYYRSTYDFVQQNNLESLAENLFGESWQAEDDCLQIEDLIRASNIEDLMVVYHDSLIDEDDIEVKERVFELTINDLKKFSHYCANILAEHNYENVETNMLTTFKIFINFDFE